MEVWTALMLKAMDVLAMIAVAGLFLVWLAYPAVMGMLAMMRRRPAPAVRGSVRVSVVIASREPADAVAQRIADCLRTDYPANWLEVIVARDRLEVEPAALDTAGLAVPVRVVPADAGGGKAAALNAAVRAATGDVLVFADTYQRFEETTIPLLVGALMQAHMGAVSGSLRFPEGTGTLVSGYWAAERWLRRAESRVHSAVGVTGAVWAMRRELWSPLPLRLILDDVYTPMRLVLAGYRVGFEQRACARELRKPTPTEEYDRKVRTLTGVLQLCAWLPAVLLPWRNPIWIQFVSHKLLRLLTPYCVTILAIWAVVRGALAFHPLVSAMAATLAATAVLVLRNTSHPVALRIRSMAAEAFLLQAAVVRAGLNGLRGRWEVWNA